MSHFSPSTASRRTAERVLFSVRPGNLFMGDVVVMPKVILKPKNEDNIPQEFVTHWPAVRGVAVTVLLLVVGPTLAAIGVAAVPKTTWLQIRQSLATVLPKKEPSTAIAVVDIVDREVTKPVVPAVEVVPAATKISLMRTIPAPSVLAVKKSPPKIVAIEKKKNEPRQSRHLRIETELLYEVQMQVTELDVRSKKGFSEQLFQLAATEQRSRYAVNHGSSEPFHPLLGLLKDRPDLHGLPMRDASQCQTSSQQAQKAAKISLMINRTKATAFRRFAGTSGGSLSFSESLQNASSDAVRKLISETESWHNHDSVSTLEQMLQVEDILMRLELVNVLSSIGGFTASEALARRAIFDFSPDVRSAAREALSKRPRKEYRAVLLKGFRYPWPAVANFSAEAVVAVNDIEATVDLIKLLDLPDPAAPRRQPNGGWAVTELVRVNHLRNCQLCHAPSLRHTDPVRGLIPTPGRPLSPAYYSGRSRSSGFVRADVTYLKQDFSVMHMVEKPNKWPTMQRFDYFLRTRAATAEEITASSPTKNQQDSYPQRKAVLYALHKLTSREARD